MYLKSYFLFAALCLSIHTMAQETSEWVGTWATAAEFTGEGDMPKESLTNRSLREIVHVSIGGDRLCLRLSNEFSAQPVVIKSVFVADALDSCDIAIKTARYLAFGGKKSVSIAPGQCAVSDPCKYQLKPGQRLAVTINYGETPKNATSHRGSRTTSYIIKGEAKPKTSFAKGERVDHWYNIAAIDVPNKGQQCFAVLGNSITDGRGSTTNMQNRWTDIMANTLYDNGREWSVLNLGIGGNSVVEGGLSEPALKRFDRDMLGQNGVTAVVLFEGINDIGGSNGRSEKTAENLIDAFKVFAKKAHDKGLKVYMGTIMPYGKSFYDNGNFFKEAARQTFNQWIRTTKDADGVIDFDQLMRDERHPLQLREDLQEDWLHPNAKGYRVMGEYAAKCILGM